VVVWPRERCNEETHNPKGLSQHQCPGEAGEHENEVQVSPWIKERRNQEANCQENTNKKHDFADDLEIFRECGEQVKSEIREWGTLDMEVISNICCYAVHIPEIKMINLTVNMLVRW